MKIKWLNILFITSLFGLAACSESKSTNNNDTSNDRWYTQEKVKRGKILYQNNCAQCHKKDASGHANAEQDFSAPALNGTEHTWHHPMSILQRTVKHGGVPLGGTMPSFSDKLTNEEINDILAWVQSHWPDKIYTLWDKRNTQSLLNK